LDLIIQAVEEDGPAVCRITAGAGVFSPEEVECVSELWQEYIEKGPQVSGYFFVVLKEEGAVKGYACYGPRSLTQGTYDLYWIAVDPAAKRGGVGRALMERVEKDIAGLGGRLLVVETSGLEKYIATRAFYEGIGYNREATIRDFYAPGDDLVVYTRKV
jgi:D-alanine-D-alanine ligase